MGIQKVMIGTWLPCCMYCHFCIWQGQSALNLPCCSAEVEPGNSLCCASSAGHLKSEGVAGCRSRGSDDDTILLPLGIWTAVALAADDVRVEVGVLDGTGAMHMGSREYGGGRLSRVCLQTLEKN